MNVENFNGKQMTIDIAESLGTKAAINYANCIMLIINKARHSTYLDELDTSDHWVIRLLVAKDGSPVLITICQSNNTAYVYSIQHYQVKRYKKDLKK